MRKSKTVSPNISTWTNYKNLIPNFHPRAIIKNSLRVISIYSNLNIWTPLSPNKSLPLRLQRWTDVTASNLKLSPIKNTVNRCQDNQLWMNQQSNTNTTAMAINLHSQKFKDYKNLSLQKNKYKIEKLTQRTTKIVLFGRNLKCINSNQRLQAGRVIL